MPSHRAGTVGIGSSSLARDRAGRGQLLFITCIAVDKSGHCHVLLLLPICARSWCTWCPSQPRWGWVWLERLLEKRLLLLNKINSKSMECSLSRRTTSVTRLVSTHLNSLFHKTQGLFYLACWEASLTQGCPGEPRPMLSTHVDTRWMVAALHHAMGCGECIVQKASWKCFHFIEIPWFWHNICPFFQVGELYLGFVCSFSF